MAADGLDPMAVIYSALAAQASGESVDEGAVHDAVVLLTAAQLASSGASIEAIERQFVERDYTIRVNYDSATGELDVGVDWADGEAG